MWREASDGGNEPIGQMVERLSSTLSNYAA
jgi:hypothetical protein